MKLPTLRAIENLQRWADDLVLALERVLPDQRGIVQRMSIIDLVPFETDNLPPPRKGGLVCTVRDLSNGILMLVSTDSGEWRRVDNLSTYPPP